MATTLCCPGCDANLRITGVLAPGKRIQCPRCETRFAVPGEDEDEAPPAKAAVTRTRNAPPPPIEDEEPEDRPVARKPRRKRPKPSNQLPLVLGLVFGVLLLLGGGVTAAVFLWPKKKADGVASTSPPVTPGPTDQGPAGGPVVPPAGSVTPAPTGGNASQPAAGRQVFDDNGCARCHSLSGGGGGRGKGGRGPSLARVGANPRHTVDSLMAFIRDPKAENPTSRMPSYDKKIQTNDLRALAEFLASLK